MVHFNMIIAHCALANIYRLFVQHYTTLISLNEKSGRDVETKRVVEM